MYHSARDNLHSRFYGFISLFLLVFGQSFLVKQIQIRKVLGMVTWEHGALTVVHRKYLQYFWHWESSCHNRSSRLLNNEEHLEANQSVSLPKPVLIRSTAGGGVGVGMGGGGGGGVGWGGVGMFCKHCISEYAYRKGKHN